MPTYEYRCPTGHEFEVFQRMSDEPGAACPECGKPAERLLSGGAGLLFKGSGFYITDYRSDDYKKKASQSDSSGGSSGDSSSGGSSDSSSSGSSDSSSSSSKDSTSSASSSKPTSGSDSA